MNIEKINSDKDLRIYHLDYINATGYECEQGVEYFNCDLVRHEANRVIQMKLEDRDMLYTRNSNRLSDNTIRFGNLKIKYTYEKNKYAYYIINEKRLYMGKVDDVENLDIISVINKHMRRITSFEGCYKDNSIKKLIKILDKAYEMVFGDSEAELTYELKAELIQLRKKEVLQSKYELDWYEKNLANLKKIASRDIKSIVNAEYKNRFIDRFLVIDSPLNKNEKVRLSCITSQYAEHLLGYFNLITDEQSDRLNYGTIKPGDFEGYTLVMKKQNDIIVTLNLIRIDNTVGVVITKGNDDTSCREARDYIDLRMISTYEHYGISDVPDQYALILISILLQTKVIDKYTNIRRMYGFRDINRVKYIGEI